MSETFVNVTGTLRRITDSAVLIEHRDAGEAWISRRRVFAPDDQWLEKAQKDVIGNVVTIMVSEWVARKNGLY